MFHVSVADHVGTSVSIVLLSCGATASVSCLTMDTSNVIRVLVFFLKKKSRSCLFYKQLCTLMTLEHFIEIQDAYHDLTVLQLQCYI